MAKVLVVGGAGYVGSAIACVLQDRGHDVWILDDLSTGHRSAVRDRTKFIESSAGDVHVLDEVFANHRFDGVFFFAAKSVIAESTREPERYFENNVVQTRKFLEVLTRHQVKHFIFSSTCAVYGAPERDDLDETHPRKPVNPYGETKVAIEDLLAEYAAKGLKSISLRCFNAAGCEFGFRVGEHHDPESHLIPLVLKAALEGGTVNVFGTDYPTRDGSCVRDYIHVNDLADGHIAALEFLQKLESFGHYQAINLGSGNGYSVLEVIATVEKISGKKINVESHPRRAGDSPSLVANTRLASEKLGVQPRENLETILRTALEWEKRKAVRKKAIFLDRDGTINFDPNYLNDAEKFALLPGVTTALRAFRDEGYLLYVVSNQSGVGRGMITPDQLHRIHEKMDRLLSEAGVRIEEYALCFHRPDEGCDCRKPQPKLVNELSRKYGLELSESIMVGDKISDIELGRNAGCGENVYLMCGNESKADYEKANGNVKTNFVFADLHAFAKARFPERF